MSQLVKCQQNQDHKSVTSTTADIALQQLLLFVSGKETIMV